VRRALLLVLVLACAGCGSGGGPTIAKSKLPALVLQEEDVAAFSQFGNGTQVSADAHPGPRHDPQRFGRLGGWISRYKRSGSTTTRGPLVIESRADLFHSTGGAKKDLAAYADELDATAASVGGRELHAPSVGDDAHAFVYGTGAARFYAVAWRHGSATASVVVQGFHVGLGDAVALARKQERRLASAG
jgi:hypothetical protein